MPQTPTVRIHLSRGTEEMNRDKHRGAVPCRPDGYRDRCAGRRRGRTGPGPVRSRGKDARWNGHRAVHAVEFSARASPRDDLRRNAYRRHAARSRRTSAQRHTLSRHMCGLSPRASPVWVSRRALCESNRRRGVRDRRPTLRTHQERGATPHPRRQSRDSTRSIGGPSPSAWTIAREWK